MQRYSSDKLNLIHLSLTLPFFLFFHRPVPSVFLLMSTGNVYLHLLSLSVSFVLEHYTSAILKHVTRDISSHLNNVTSVLFAFVWQSDLTARRREREREASVMGKAVVTHEMIYAKSICQWAQCMHTVYPSLYPLEDSERTMWSMLLTFYWIEKTHDKDEDESRTK